MGSSAPSPSLRSPQEQPTTRLSRRLVIWTTPLHDTTLRLCCPFLRTYLSSMPPGAVTSRVGMPAYYLHDCHYFFRTALRGLNISTSVSPLYL